MTLTMTKTMTKTVNDEMGKSKWDSELARLSTYWSARNGKWDSELARLSTYGAQEISKLVNAR